MKCSATLTQEELLSYEASKNYYNNVFDWGEEDINFRAYFLDPTVFNYYAERNEI